MLLGPRRRRALRRGPRSWRRAAKRLGPPIFALKGAGAPRQGGFGWSGDGTCEVTVVQAGEHGEVTVETGPRPNPFPSEWMLLSNWLHAAIRFGVEPTFPVELRADRWVATVTCAGAPSSFTFVGDHEVWVAEGVVAGRQVRLEGRGPTDGLELHVVSRRAVKANR